MDGASKFVRGDAIAGILILFINVIGGLIMGVPSTTWMSPRPRELHAACDRRWSCRPNSRADHLCRRPVVSRVGTDDYQRAIGGQAVSSPRVLVLTAAIVGLMGLIPGMPHAFLCLPRCSAAAPTF